MVQAERGISENMVRYLRRTVAKADSESPESDAQKAFVRAWAVGQWIQKCHRECGM
jgi:hypothetical protein